MQLDPAALRERLRHVYWVGGGSGAGKSTVARRIAAERGLQLYLTDDVMAEHARRCPPERCPALHAFMAMDMDERWLSRSPEAMLASFHWFRGEGFGLIVEDLLGLPSEPAVIAEGFRLLPRLVAPLLAERRRAAWLLPAPAFRQAVFAGRGGAGWGFIAKTSDPARALAKLLDRDEMFTRRLAAETEELGLTSIQVDATLTAEELAGKLERGFGLGSPPGSA